MKKYYHIILISFSLMALLSACKKSESPEPPFNEDPFSGNLTIFMVNDLHAQLHNFSRIKYIVEQEEKESTVLVVSGGDNFSGNPIVDNYEEKGYPLIDIMNNVGVDISTVGNHEFDYGISTLGDRMLQSDFPWVCANLDPHDDLSHKPYYTITADSITITFLGLVETYGKPDDIIPSTHPWKVEGLSFHEPQDVIGNYENLKESEGADLCIALTHTGTGFDFLIANEYPFFDMIIGAHTHILLDTVVNGIPVFQAGSYLHHLGKIQLEMEEGSVKNISYDLIDLDTWSDFDPGTQQRIDMYENSMPELDEVIGYSAIEHTRYDGLGCFFTDALRMQLEVDVTFQNFGGIRNILDKGDITKREIYAISPFNNGTIIYDMTVAEIRNFLRNSSQALFYSGIMVEQDGDEVIIKNYEGQVLEDTLTLRVGLVDYIPAVYDMYFPPPAAGSIQPYTDAETIIMYLQSHPGPVNYPMCSRFFSYSD